MYKLINVINIWISFLILPSIAYNDDLINTTAISSPLLRPRSVRLPNATFPLHYHLHIKTNIHRGDFMYAGNVTIDVDVRESTDEIVLHTKELKNCTIFVYDLGTGLRLNDLTYSYDANNSFLIVHAHEYYQVFEAGFKYRLEILYDGIINEIFLGLYWLQYQNNENEAVYQAATQFEPTGARLAFPCYDEPAFKANFSICLTHGNTYQAISNMPVRSIQPGTTDNQLTTCFYTTPPISTYLVAFAISNFGYITAEYRGLTQRLYTHPSTINKGEKQLNASVHILAAMEDFLGLNYSLAKLDHIALNKKYGAAMENWGLIMYKESFLLYDDEADSQVKFKGFLTLAHEIAHQWFGNLVSPIWWTYAWLTEGFATYFSYIIIDLLHPEFQSMEYFLVEIAAKAYSYNEYSMRPHPMTYYVENENDIRSVFDIISYQKAACVIKMFHHAFNQRTFMRGINHYLIKHQYSVVNEYDLFESLQNAVSDESLVNKYSWTNSVSEILLSWSHNKWIPIVTVQRNYDANSITIRQKSKNIESIHYFWIPLNFASASDYNFERTTVDYFMPPVKEITLNASDLNIMLSNDDWLIVNKQQTGFYHVLYDDENLMKIVQALQENHLLIHELNRADIFQNIQPRIEHYDIQSAEVIFELLKYLHYEESLLVWNFATPIVDLLGRNLYGTATHEYYEKFIRYLVAPVYNRLFNKPTIDDELTVMELTTQQSILSLACEFDLPECIKHTQRLAEDRIFRNVQVNSNSFMSDAVICAGMRYLNDSQFDAILEVLSKSASQDYLLYAIPCTQNERHMQKYLKYLISADIVNINMNISDSLINIFYMFKSNMAARPIIWRFIEHHYKSLISAPFFLEMFNRLSEYVHTEHFKQYRDLHQQITIALRDFNDMENKTLIAADSSRIGRKVKTTESFLQRFGTEIHEWLQHNQFPVFYASIAKKNKASKQHPRILWIASNLFKTLFHMILLANIYAYSRMYFTLEVGVILIICSSLAVFAQFENKKGTDLNYIPYGEFMEKDSPDINYRLPDDLRPDHYDINLRPYLLESDKENRFTFDGEVFINITVLKRTNKIVLHSKNLKFSKSEYCQDINESLSCTSFAEADPDNKTDIVTYILKKELQVNSVYILHFKYKGSMDNDMHGFYRSSYTNSKNETEWLGTTQFQTNHARRAFPSFDEPKFKSTFKVTITRHKSMKTASNTNMLRAANVGDYYEDEYETTPIMSTYLLAFIVSRFTERTDDNGSFGILARPDYYAQTEYSFVVGQEILEILDKYFDLPFYTLGIDKMQMAAIPDFSAGAMENWGLLTYRERLLLYTEEGTTLHVKQQIAAVIAHEQAHQWFGNLVTCDWWSYAWLNEGFARYFQYFATDKVEEEFELDKQFVTEQIQSVMVKDSMNDTNPLSDENTNTPSDLNRMFNSISYNKGATFIRTVRHIMGEEKFQKSLQDYLKTYRYQNTIPQNLFDTWKKYMDDEEADDFFLKFTTQVGYPVITFNLTSPKTLEISQKRFLLKDNDGSDPTLRYVVPITYTTDSEKDFNNTQPKFFIRPVDANKIVELNDNVSWVIGNIQVTGYYRMNYDEKTWHKIHHALFEDHWSNIPDVNRAQIVDDLFNLARSGTISYDLALDVLEYLETETDYLPWFAALNGYSFLAVRLGTDTSNFASYFLHLSDRAYRKLGFEENQNDTTLDIYNREQILNWSCKYGNKECIEKIKGYFGKDLIRNPVPINIRAIVYCAAMREGDNQDFDKLFDKYLSETAATEKTLILNSLGCVKDNGLVNRYFDVIMSNEIRRQDKSSALASLYNENNENVEVVFDLIDSNLNQFVAAMGGYSAAATSITGIASRFTEKSQEEKLKNFNARHRTEFGDAATTLDIAEKIVAENLEWAENKLNTFKNYLESRSKSTSTRNSANTIIIYILGAFALIALLKT
ncbi:uncharacterized protein ACN427_006527 [Glossina fuscipes fuscipes]